MGKKTKEDGTEEAASTEEAPAADSQPPVTGDPGARPDLEADQAEETDELPEDDEDDEDDERMSFQELPEAPKRKFGPEGVRRLNVPADVATHDHMVFFKGPAYLRKSHADSIEKALKRKARSGV